jgi:hypothetical protein
VRIDIEAKALTVMSGALGIVAALTLSAPTALADPALPPPPPPAPDATVQAAAGDPATPPDGTPHLSSLQNLPPGTTDSPPDGNQPRGLGYLRDLWHAVQTQDVSGKDALLLLTQRPMNADAAPPPGMPANPTPPSPPSAPLAPLAPGAPPVP